MSNPLHKTCSKCKKELPATLEYFYREKIVKSGLSSRCKKCKYECSKKYKRKYARRYKRHNPEYAREYHLRKTYGITIEQYNQMVGAQGGVCAICRSPETLTFKSKIKPLSVDHDHKTGKVRQLLCDRCNNVLGRVDDDKELLLRLSLYLEKWAND